MITGLAAGRNLNSFEYLADDREQGAVDELNEWGEPRCIDDLGSRFRSEVKSEPNEHGEESDKRGMPPGG